MGFISYYLLYIDNYSTGHILRFIVGPSDPSSSVTSDNTTAHEGASPSTSDTESTVDSCQCQCCLDLTIPHHPIDLSKSGVTYTHRNKGSAIKSYSRHIQLSWYKSFPWISVLIES